MGFRSIASAPGHNGNYSQYLRIGKKSTKNHMTRQAHPFNGPERRVVIKMGAASINPFFCPSGSLHCASLRGLAERHSGGRLFAGFRDEFLLRGEEGFIPPPPTPPYMAPPTNKEHIRNF